jgi:hypothetical protein
MLHSQLSNKEEAFRKMDERETGVVKSLANRERMFLCTTHQSTGRVFVVWQRENVLSSR